MRGIYCLAVYVLGGFLVACGDTPTAPTPVLPTLAGAYTGTYTTTSCVEQGAAIGSGFCAAVGQGGNHGYTPTQSGSTLGGSIYIGGITLPVTGNVGTDQIVHLSGTGTVTQGASINVTTWRGTLSGAQLSGNFQFTIATTDPPGTGIVQATFTLFR